MARRVVVHTFDGSGTFAPSEIQGGTSEAFVDGVNGGVESGGTLYLQGGPTLDQTSYRWLDSDDGPVCGAEVSFKATPIDGHLELDVGLSLGPGSGDAYSSISFEFIVNPRGGPAPDFGPISGLVGAFAYGEDALGNSTAEEPVSGDRTDVVSIDFGSWMTAKLLPTGAWSLAYQGGATILSGTLPAIADVGGMVEVAGVYEESFDSDLGVSVGGVGDLWVDDVVLWINQPATMPPLRVYPRADPIAGGQGRPWPMPASVQSSNRRGSSYT